MLIVHNNLGEWRQLSNILWPNRCCGRFLSLVLSRSLKNTTKKCIWHQGRLWLHWKKKCGKLCHFLYVYVYSSESRYDLLRFPLAHLSPKCLLKLWWTCQSDSSGSERFLSVAAVITLDRNQWGVESKYRLYRCSQLVFMFNICKVITVSLHSTATGVALTLHTKRRLHENKGPYVKAKDVFCGWESRFTAAVHL